MDRSATGAKKISATPANPSAADATPEAEDSSASQRPVAQSVTGANETSASQASPIVAEATQAPEAGDPPATRKQTLRSRIVKSFVAGFAVIGVVSSIMGVLGVSLRDLWEPDDALPGAPTYAGGWGPDRTMYRLHEDEIPTHPAFNAFSDNAVFGDERNFVGMRLPTDVVNGDNVWSDRLEVEPGDTVIVRAFYENAAPDNYDSIPTSWLQGATARFYVPAEASEDVSVGVTLSASNAASVWDGATALASEPVRLVPITGSGIIETNAPGLDFDAVSAATGAPFHLGFETNDGVIKPGFEYAGYIVMQFRVEPG